jgi:hypothetical protein
MKKCLFFFLGLIAALCLAVLTGMNSGEAKPQVLQASLEAEASQGDALASETPQKPGAKRITPETKVP